MPTDTQKDEKAESTARSCDKSGALVALLFGAMAIAMAVATVGFEIMGHQDDGGTAGQASEGSLAGLLLFGVLTFFFAIASLIALFRALGLTNQEAALGMPQGSIRAFMALVLIMLFFLMAVFLYLDVSRTGTERRVVGVTQESYDQLVAGGQVIAAFSYAVPDPNDPTSEVQRWDVTLKAARERSEVAEDIARQLVTVLGTLIVAIAAFYFGSNSVQRAWRTEQKYREPERPEDAPVGLRAGATEVYVPPPAG